jgi:rhodanese-related sulfurtransferase
VELGYRDVSIMAKGIDGWIKKGMPLEQGGPPS